MEQMLIRNLPPGTKARLKARAVRHGRTTEAEARALLAEALDREPSSLVDLIATDEVDVVFEPEPLGLTARTAEL